MYSAGTVFLQVVPSYDNLQKSVRREALAAGKAFEDEFGKSSEASGKRAGKVLGTELEKEATKAADRAGTKSGDSYTGAFRAAMKKGIAGVEKELKGIQVKEIFSDDALKSLPRVRDRLRELKRQAGDIKVDLDAAGTMAEIKQIEAMLKVMQSNAANIEVRTNAGAALAEISAVRASLEHLDRVTVEPEIKIDRQLGAFERKLRSGIDAALRDLPPVDLEVDNSAVNRAIAETRAELYALRDAHIGVDIDAGAAMSRLAEIQTALEGIDTNTVDIGVRIDAAAAAGHLAAIEAEVRHLDGKQIDVKVDTDAGAAVAKLGLLNSVLASAGHGTDDAANSFRAFNMVILGAVTLGPMLIPILAAIAGGAAAAGVAIAGLVGGIGVLAVGLSGIIPAVQAMGKVQDKAAKDSLTAGKTMRAAANSVRDAEQSLARARLDAARATEDGGKRIADAERNLTRARQDAARAAQDADRKVADARRNLVDVTERANRSIASAERNLADAQRNLARTRADVAERNQRAADDIVRAERRVYDAQRASQQAQEDLAKARRQAAEDIVDANYEARGAALAQQEAALRLQDAQKEYNRVMGREYKSPRAVQEVTLALQEAQLAYEQSQTNAQRASAAADDANKKGVDGADAVVNAQQQVLDAQQSQLDATAALSEAQKEADKVHQEGLQSIADAQRDVRDATLEARQAHKDAARDIADAHRAVTDALRDEKNSAIDSAQAVSDAQRQVADAHESAARAAADSAASIQQAQQRVVDAQASYQDALTQTAAIGSASAMALDNAMAKLSPAGREFARFIYGLKDDFYGLRAAIQEGMLPGLQNGLQMIIDTYGPGLKAFVTSMAGTLGTIFEQVGKVLTGPIFQQFFGTLADLGPRFMRDFATMSLNWLQVFARLMTLSAPLAIAFSNALVKLSQNALDWVQSAKGTKTWQDFMGFVQRVGPMVWDFFKNLGGALLNIGRAIAPYAVMVLNVFSGLLGFISGLDPQVLGAIIVGVLGLVIAFQAATGATALLSGAVSIFGKTAEGAFKNPLGIAIFMLILLGTALVEAYQHSETFRNIVNAALDAVGWAFGKLVDGIKWAWEHVLAPTWGAIEDAAKWLWEHGLKQYFGFIWDYYQTIFKAMVWAWDNILKPSWEAISTAAGWLWGTILSPIFGFIGAAWSTLATGIRWVWNNIWYPIIELVGTVIGDLWKLGLSVVFAAIKGGWEAVGASFKWVWENVISPAWNALKDGIQWVWDHVLHPIFSGFIDLLGGKEGLQAAFQHAVDGIKTIWDGLKDIAKAPIRFIIQTVLNDGLISGFNWLADKFGTKKMGEIPLPKGFADGGYTGPGGRYDPAGIVHADEYVVSSPARRRFEKTHPGVLDYINRTGRMPGYSSGGWVKPIRAPYGLGYGNTYTGGRYHSGQDFPAPVGTPVFAALPGVIAQVLRLFTSYGHHIVMESAGGMETLYAHLSNIGVNVGQAVAAGQQIGLSGATGHVTGPHLHFEVRPGGGYSHAVNPVPFLSGAEGAPKGESGGFLDAITNPFGWLKDKVLGAIHKMDDTPFNALVQGVPMKALDLLKGLIGDAASGAWHFATDVAGKAGDALGAINPFGGGGDVQDNGVKMYDAGGYLPPGLTTVLNATGKPEPVFTSGQWAALERQQGAGGAGGAGGLSIGQLVAADPEEAVAKIRTSQSDAAAVANLRDIANGVG